MKIRRFSSSTCRCNVFLLKQIEADEGDLRAPKGNYVSYVGLRFFFCKYRILYQLPEQPILRDDFTNHRLVRFLLGFVKQSRDNFVVTLPVSRKWYSVRSTKGHRLSRRNKTKHEICVRNKYGSSNKLNFLSFYLTDMLKNATR